MKTGNWTRTERADALFPRLPEPGRPGATIGELRKRMAWDYTLLRLALWLLWQQGRAERYYDGGRDGRRAGWRWRQVAPPAASAHVNCRCHPTLEESHAADARPAAHDEPVASAG